VAEWTDAEPPPSPAEDARTRTSAIRAGRRILLTEGPDGISCEAVARAAGCDVSDVTRLFGSDAGLTDAVGRHLVSVLGAHTAAVAETGPASFAPLLDTLFAESDLRRVFVRSVAEDRELVMTLTHDNPVNALVRWIERTRGRHRGRVPVRTRVCVFASVSLLFGWLSGAEQFVEGLGLDVFSEAERNAAMAAAAGSVARAALSDEPALPTVTRRVRRSPSPAAEKAREFLASMGGVPPGPPGRGLEDPRLAAAAAAALVQGAIVGERKLRALTGLAGSVNVEPAVTTFAGMLLANAQGGPERPQP
jgi:AcrR family transcriptional regulator